SAPSRRERREPLGILVVGRSRVSAGVSHQRSSGNATGISDRMRTRGDRAAKRRSALALLGAAPAALSARLGRAEARLPRVGLLLPGTPASPGPSPGAGRA